ncbi:MAG: hypothetical protein JXQ29_14655 [Planctomycetes bacterium]|nr:hypothetical protein [Planctomycetota bacterium]
MRAGGGFPRPVLAAALWLLVGSAARGQIYPGDVVFASQYPDMGIGVVDMVAGRTTRFVPTSRDTAGVWPDPDGIHVVSVMHEHNICSTLRPALVRFDPATGALATCRVIPTSTCTFAGGLSADQDGAFICAMRSSWSELWRVDASAAVRLETIEGSIHAIARDEDTGEWWLDVDRSQNGAILRWTPGSGFSTVTAVYTGRAILHDGPTGHFWHLRTPRLTLRHRAQGTPLTTLEPIFAAVSVVQDPVTGDFIAGSQDRRLARIARDGTVVRIWSALTAGVFTGLYVWGSRPLAGAGPATPGSTYTVRLRFPGSPGRPYAAAASLGGIHPGIALPHGVIPIAPDVLFFLTLGRDLPGLTTGFAGTLDRLGRASLSIQLPFTLPRSTLLTIGAAAVNPTRPAMLDVGASITLAIR